MGTPGKPPSWTATEWEEEGKRAILDLLTDRQGVITHHEMEARIADRGWKAFRKVQPLQLSGALAQLVNEGQVVDDPGGVRAADELLGHLGLALLPKGELVEPAVHPVSVLVLDTSAFHELVPFRQIDWRTITEGSDPELLVTLTVLDELEGQKTHRDSEVRQRAREYLRLLEAADGETPTEQLGLGKSGRLRIVAGEPNMTTYAGHPNDQTNDDRIIARALELARGVPNGALAALSMDLSFRTRARHRGLRLIEAPSSLWRRGPNESKRTP